MKNEKTLRRSALIMLISLLLLAVAITSVAYAWFTFTTSSRVEPLAGTVSGGGVNLLISNSAAGPFDRSCALILSSDTDLLEPVTTSDLASFYVPTGQNAEGIPSGYRDVSADAGQYLLSGTVWLRSEGGACRVFFHRNNLSLGQDNQALAAMRLGLKLYTASGNFRYIFKLDDMGDTSRADRRWTIAQPGTVYGGEYVQDPSVNIGTYCASGAGKAISSGGSSLCYMRADETIRVEYWLYLEGCDENCINSVQSRDLDLQLGFAGIE